MSRHRAPEHPAAAVAARPLLQAGIPAGRSTVVARRPLPPVPAVTR